MEDTDTVEISMIDHGMLKAFVAVATELHFRKAALRLNMSQPPLSRKIQLLEEYLNVRLFERTSRVVALTCAGKTFLAEARSLLERTEQAITATRRAARSTAGSATIGFIGVSTYDFLPRLAVLARRDLPHIELTFKEMTTREQLEAIAFGHIDIGLTRPLTTVSKIAADCVMRQGFSLAIHQSHPLAIRATIRLAHLNKQSLIMYAPEAQYLNTILVRAFKRGGVSPNYVQMMNSSQAMLSLVSTGMGLAIVPEGTQNACFRNVVFRPISLGKDIWAELHAIYSPFNRNLALSPLREVLHRCG